MSAITLPRPPVERDGPVPQLPDKNKPWGYTPAPDHQPSWARPALIVLLVATAALYLWGLGASGWANSFYSAAVQAGTKSWKALFFGSSDAANFITIDKPPAALWVMELSARLFGVNAWSILVPQALEGVAAVGLLYAGVRRWFGAAAGLIAGAVLAVTPVAALMFRFNNPDALLVLTLTAAAYALVRALEEGRTRWLIAVGTLVGFGFVTKMLQALLVVPAFALVYLFAGPPKLGRRVLQLLLAAVALAVSSLWWVVAVMAVPGSQRPYIGGSQNNSLWNLIFGYNGFGRLTGSESGSVGGGGGTTGRWGPTGWLRMFNSDFGGQISWLLPAALLFLAAGLVLTMRGSRTDRGRAGLMFWGGWLLVTAAVFSLGQGIIHPYYTVALAPAIGALVGIGAAMWWARRSTWTGRGVLSAVVLATVWWAYVLLRRSPAWHPWLRGAEVGVGLVAVALIVAGFYWRSRWVAVGVAVTMLFVGFAGPTAYALSTVSTPHTGAIPSAGPAVVGGGFGRGGRGGPGFGGGSARPGAGAGATPPAGGRTGGFALGGGAARLGPGGFGGAAPAGGPPGGGGGLLNGSTPTAALTATLKAGSGRFTWVAAAIGSNEASGYQLATGHPVMAIGGFNGTDPSPTLAQFEEYVRQGEIHYLIAGGGGIGGGAFGGGAFGGGAFGGGAGATTSPAAQINSWVASHFISTAVGGVTLYDLTAPTSS